MSLSRIGTLVVLELTQRIRSVAWYVLLGVFALILLAVTSLSFFAFAGTGSTGSGIYSTVVYVVLLLAMLVSPTVSGNAINGDRDAATLAPVQVTLATTGEIVLGKLLAAWATGLAFAVVAAPFILLACAAGGVSLGAVVVSLAVLIVEIGVVAAVGVGLSGLIARPLFSVAATYLVVAALAVGTLVAFGLGGASIQSQGTAHSRFAEYRPDVPAREISPEECAAWLEGGSARACSDLEQQPAFTCGPWQTHPYSVARFDYVWWILAANPFVILADATPTTFNSAGYPSDLFGQFTLTVRQAQQPPELERTIDDCDPAQRTVWNPPAPRDVLAETAPSWFVGLGVQLVLAAALVLGAWARTRTPARRLPPGTRIA